MAISHYQETMKIFCIISGRLLLLSGADKQANVQWQHIWKFHIIGNNTTSQ